MFAARNLHKQSFKSLSSLLHCRPSKSVSIPKALSSNAVRPNDQRQNEGGPWFSSPLWRREMSTSPPPRGRSMRSKVERRMKNESGKTMREVRRAKKIQKKLMTENERLVFNLKRAKKKVAVLLQKLKKYELPELPPPLHDPEILTPEQLQAYKKIGFKNKNYVPVGVRGVFGGVVQNMHMHWKFHETVQVCCDNFPKEKIKEMATVIARLSGGIVINVHSVKTIIMYRGRNYRQPKNLIPFNTLTKRKALFKARFEQALESQKLNIKKIEQQLRRSGINPEDPAATASIQRVASSFFNAIDNKDGTPYVFRENKLSLEEADTDFGPPEPSDEREQAELDKFIADIEDAAEREWAAEEAAEKEDLNRIRYWNREDFSGRFRRSGASRDDQYGDDDDGDDDDEIRGSRTRKDTRSKPVRYGSDDEDGGDDDSDSGDSRERESFKVSGRDLGKQGRFGGTRSSDGFKINAPVSSRKSIDDEESEAFSDLENAMWRSDDEDDDDDDDGQHDSSASKARNRGFRSESDDEESYDRKAPRRGIVPYEHSADDLEEKNPSWLGESSASKWKQNETDRPRNDAALRSSGAKSGRKWADEDFGSGEANDEENDPQASRARNYDCLTSDDEDDDEKYRPKRDSKDRTYTSSRQDRDSD